MDVICDLQPPQHQGSIEAPKVGKGTRMAMRRNFPHSAACTMGLWGLTRGGHGRLFLLSGAAGNLTCPRPVPSELLLFRDSFMTSARAVKPLSFGVYLSLCECGAAPLIPKQCSKSITSVRAFKPHSFATQFSICECKGAPRALKQCSLNFYC